MSDRINLLRRVSELNKSPQFDSYSKVIIHIDDETDITVGDDYGRTLEFTNPFGTRQMAVDLLAKLRGFQYQPYTASGALLDPAAEIGDGIAVKDIYGGLYTRVRTFNRLMKADISAPHDEEINHEYQFETPQERKIKRQFGDVRATFAVQAGLIEARVSKTSPEGQTSFSWSLTDSAHVWYANGSEVMRVNSSGLKVKGRIEATSGYIGNGTSGFTISARALYNGMTSLGDTTHNGVYVGVDGIALGKGAFKVTSSGSITASNMSLSGTLNVGGQNITAENLRLGAERCNSGYTGWNGTTSTVNTNGGNWTSAYNWKNSNGDYCIGGADFGYNFDSMKYGGGNAFPINASSFRYNGTQLRPQTISILDGNKNVRTFYGVMMEIQE